VLLDQFNGRLGIVVDEKRSHCVQHAIGLRTRDVKATIWKRTVVTRRHDQIFAAFAPVGTGEADVDNPREPHVVMVPSPNGGCSTTIGPFDRFTTAM
jgi:hypothetical protein